MVSWTGPGEMEWYERTGRCRRATPSDGGYLRDHRASETRFGGQDRNEELPLWSDGN